MALGATLPPVPAAAAGGGAVLTVSVRVVAACSVTAPGAGPRPPKAAPPGLDHRCTGPVPHHVTLRPALPEQAHAAPEHDPGRTAVRQTHEAGRDVVIVTVTY